MATFMKEPTSSENRRKKLTVVEKFEENALSRAVEMARNLFEEQFAVWKKTGDTKILFQRWEHYQGLKKELDEQG